MTTAKVDLVQTLELTSYPTTWELRYFFDPLLLLLDLALLALLELPFDALAGLCVLVFFELFEKAMKLIDMVC